MSKKCISAIAVFGHQELPAGRLPISSFGQTQYVPKQSEQMIPKRVVASKGWLRVLVWIVSRPVRRTTPFCIIPLFIRQEHVHLQLRHFKIFFLCIGIRVHTTSRLPGCFPNLRRRAADKMRD